MAYNSDINLRLGETPKTTDPAVFPDMVEIYNAIHILAQWTNAIKDQGQSGGPEKKPWEAMEFDRWFYVKAARKITRGSVITVVGSTQFKVKEASTRDRPVGDYYTLEGAINGAAGPGIPYAKELNEPGTLPLNGGVTGMALGDAEEGELVQFGIGPAIVNIEGIKYGQPVFALAAYRNNPSYFQGYWTELVNDGNLVTLQEYPEHYRFPSELILVGRGVAPDAMMFCPPNGWTDRGWQGNNPNPTTEDSNENNLPPVGGDA